MFNGNGRARDAGAPASGAATATSSAKRGVFSVIGPDVVITGNITATADLHIDGHIHGDVHCAALVQGPESLISGNVSAESARITGTIDGRVAARQLSVERTAKITGDIEYESLAMETGASIDGHLRHKSPGTLKLAEPGAPARTEPLLLVSDNGG